MTNPDSSPNLGRRGYQPREAFMTSEYLIKKNWWDKALIGYRLGSPAAALGAGSLPPEEQAMLRVWGRYADAIVLLDDKVVIVEAKIIPKMGPLEGLMVYERLFRSDPAFKDHHRKPITKQYVYAIEDASMVMLARQLGIETVSFRPKWVDAYALTVPERKRRGPVVGLQSLPASP